MVSVPLREPPALAAHVNATVPLPEPAAPEVIVIQGASLVAVQLQDEVVVTAAESLPVVDATLNVVGFTPNEQAAPAA
jgi:hypothetical protein